MDGSGKGETKVEYTPGFYPCDFISYVLGYSSLCVFPYI